MKFPDFLKIQWFSLKQWGLVAPDPYHGVAPGIDHPATPITPGTPPPGTLAQYWLHVPLALSQRCHRAREWFTRLLSDTVRDPEYRSGQNYHF